MKKYFLPLLLTSTLSFPVYAQKTPAGWQNLFKQSAKKSTPIYNPARLLPAPLNSTESFILESRLLALSTISRALRKNPNLPNSPVFAQYAQTLTLMGEKLPPVPPANAPASKKRQYAEQVRQVINQSLQQGQKKATHLTTKENQSYKELSSAHINWARRRSEMTLANAKNNEKWHKFEQALAAKKQTFSWGEKNWDEVRIGPAAMPQDPNDPLFGSANTLYHLAKEPPKEFFLAMDFISYSKALTPYQKQAIWQHLGQLNDVIGYPMVYVYMSLFHKVPAISAPGLMEKEVSPSLQQYARDTQLVLIEKLKKGQQWNEQQANTFFDLSVFLPGHNGKDVIAALTYLEPDAALYLLAHPQETAATRQIRQQVLSARAKAQIKDGLLIKQPLDKPLGVYNSFRRLRALAAYSDVLSMRLEKINKRIAMRKTQIKNAQQIQKQEGASNPFNTQQLKLSYQLYCQMDLLHLQQLHDKLFDRIKYVQQELMGLYKTSEFK